LNYCDIYSRLQLQLLLRDDAAEASEWRKLDVNGNGNVRATFRSDSNQT
jgi:hypothetical protein